MRLYHVERKKKKKFFDDRSNLENQLNISNKRGIMMPSNIWCALHRKEFNTNEYLYHYTSFNTVLKILCTNKLQFSPLTETNDTSEQKPRIKYNFDIASKSKEKVDEFEKYWQIRSEEARLLCFSRDKKSRKKTVEMDIFDVRGRGFALPRMWAQYAENNSGVCLILKKKKLENDIISCFPSAICSDVKYFDWDYNYKIEEKFFDELCKVIEHNPGTHNMNPYENQEVILNTFFSKDKDWESEREYRIVIPDSKEKYLYIENLDDYLVGIVLGEKMDKSQIMTIQELHPDSVSLRQISFQLMSCKLKSVDDVRFCKKNEIINK